MRVSTLTLCALLWLPACGGDDDVTPGSDATTTPDSSTTTADSNTTTPDSSSGADAGVDSTAGSDASAAPTFTEVYDDVLSQKCAPCHTSSSSGNLSMSDKATAYSNLVGIDAAGAACSSSGLKRVVASDSASSLLHQKVAGTPSCGSRMPQGRDPLETAEIELIELWIDNGAHND